MDTRRTIGEFLHLGKELFHLLNEDSEGATDIDLQLLQSQLHILEIQITNLQSFRRLRSTDGKTAIYIEAHS